MKTVIPRVRGTRDFYPEHMVLRNWIYSNIRSVCVKYGYQEWDAPILERLDLYAAKSGDELVRDQAFVFEDRGGSQVALRPELTPSLARMVAQQGNEQALPLAEGLENVKVFVLLSTVAVTTLPAVTSISCVPPPVPPIAFTVSA